MHFLGGVYAAAVTPLDSTFAPDPEGLHLLLDFLAQRGCHGALLLGTTGEGPSFSFEERRLIFEQATAIRQAHPDFRLIAGVGTPSLEETAALTRLAYDLGYDAALSLPPFYYRNASDEGLFSWFDAVLRQSVPAGDVFLAYHFPNVSGVPLSLDLLARLQDAHPDRSLGIKDSSVDLDFAQALGECFGTDLLILNGTDSLFTQALEAGAQGCITALGNLVSPELRAVWEAHQNGEQNRIAQAALNEARGVSSRYPPAASFIKLVLSESFGLPLWPVKPPLVHLSGPEAKRALVSWRTKGKIA